MGKQLVNNIRGMNPLARRGALLLLAVLTSFACLLGPRDADAAVAALSNWRNTNATLNTGTISANRYYRGSTSLPGATNTVAVAAGSNRLMVVALAVNTSVASNTLVPTVTYGTKTLTLATSDQATLSRQHTWLFYLNEADIAAAGGTNLSFTYAGTAGLTYTGTYANVAVYSGVKQATPFLYQTTYNSAGTADTAIGPLATSQVITTGDYAVSVVNALNTANATSPTVTLQTGWTARGNTSLLGANYARRAEIAYRSSAGTYTEQHTASVAVVDSMSAMTLQQQPIPGVSNGATVPNLDVYASDTNKVVDAFAVTGGGTLTSVTITGNANTTPTNISKVSIYRKGDANTTVYSGSSVDTLVGTAVTNPTFPLVYNMANESVVAGTNYIITYDIAPGAVGNGTSITLTGRVTAIAPTGGTVSDTAGATLTVLVTTTIGNTTEPPAQRVKNSSAATLLDAFTVYQTGTAGTDDDTITNIQVTLAPQYISGGSAATLSKIKLVEIVNQAQTVVYGSNYAAITGDLWSIPLTTNIPVTTTPTTYYIRISTADNIIPSINDPSGTSTGYYGVSGTVTALSHSKSNNKVVVNDTTSQTIAIDFEIPNDVTAFSALAPQTSDPDGTLNLNWTANAILDPNSGSLNGTKPYKIMRSAPSGGYPNPYCIDGTDISTAGATINYSAVPGNATDIGLVSTQATQYKYRICAVDSLGNISAGKIASGVAKVQSVCGNLPIVKLVPESQIVKSAGTDFGLQISNMDTGVCPDVTFALAIVNEGGSNPADFTHTYPSTVKLGTGGSGHAATGTSVPITISSVGTQAQLNARQLEKYNFKMTITAPGYNAGNPIFANYTSKTNPRWGSSVEGVLNDMPPIVHNSANMGKFTYGGWGQTYTCATCHSNSTTNIKGIFTLVSTPIGKRNVVFTKTSSAVTDYVGVFSNDQRTVKNGSNLVCSVCHHKTRQHQYSANKAFGGPNTSDPYESNHHNSNDCIKCHTHNTAFRSITGVCGDCHGTISSAYAPVDKATMVTNITNAMGPLPANYGAHARHTAVKVGCQACHNSTNHGLDTAGWVGDNKMQMGFLVSKDTFTGFNQGQTSTGGSFWGTTNLNFPFSWVAGAGTTINTTNDYNNSCVTYCHGNWPGNTDQGSQQQPIWGGDGNEIVCGSCHYATATTPPQGGSHNKHASNTGAGLAIACTNCHGTYASYTGAKHVNGMVEWSMKIYSTNAAAKYNGTSKGATAGLADSTKTYGNCTNLYCHSNVQSTNGTGAPTAYASPKWGGTAACGTCHAQPNQSGSHANHENAQVSFDCHVCHYNGGTTTPSNHANGYIDFQFIGLAANTVYSPGNKVPAGTVFGTCSNSDCHGRYQRAWGTVSTGLGMCDKCHGSATSLGGFYGTKGPGSAVLANISGVGVHDIHIQNLNTPRKSTFARFTSYASPFICRQCHEKPAGPFSIGHIDTPLPAEATFTNRSSIAHNGDTFGYYSTPTFNAATKVCSNIWCHGAGMNSNRGSGNYAGLTPLARTNPKWNQTFLTGNGNTDCTKCHAMPPLGAASQHLGGVTLSQCRDCHPHVGADGLSFSNKNLHVDGKVDGGCGGCHGNPPITSAIGTTDGLAAPPQNALTAGQAGAHNAHQLLPLIGSNCKTCHNGYSPAMPSNELEIGFNAIGSQVTTGKFTGYTNSVNGPHWKSSSAGTTMAKSNVKGVVCSNLYCHGGGTGNGSGSDSNNLRPIGGGANPTGPNWEGSTVCGDCHGTDNANAPTGGSHPRHALKVAAVSCESCHGVIADNGTHIKGAISWKLDRTQPVFGANATYNSISSGTIPGIVPRNNGADYRNCDNIYCHSTVQSSTNLGLGFTGVTYGSPKWGANGTIVCGSCHKDFAVEPQGATSTGSHFKHANRTLGMNVSCSYCHQDGGDGFDPMHADGNVFVNFTSYINLTGGNNYSVGAAYLTGNLKPAGSATFGTCSNTFCHGTAPSPQWGNGTTTCASCHGASKTQSATWSGRHTTHYNNMTAPTLYTDTVQDKSTVSKYVFNCAHCHDDNVARHSLKPSSALSAARVFYGISSATPATSSKRGLYVAGATPSPTDNGFKSTNGSCNTSYCHSDGKGGPPKNTNLTWTTAPSGANCLFCHDGKKTGTINKSTLSGKHDAHMNYSSNMFMGRGNGFNCVDCHAKTMNTTNNTLITNKKTHVDSMVTYSGAKANIGLNTAAGKNGECTNVYCHSNGNPNQVVYANMTGSKNWNTSTFTINTCNKCHGRSNALGYPDYVSGLAGSATSNNHFGHMSSMSTNTNTTGCADCHRKTADTLVANRFRPFSTAHLNGALDLSFNTTRINIGTKATVTRSGAQNMTVTCSQIVCHGQGAPVWGTTSPTVKSCQKCHGSKVQAFDTFSSPQVAPGYNNEGTDTSMVNFAATSPRVGAHQRHMVSNAIAAVVKCSNCHVSVKNVRDGNHWNYSTATVTLAGARAVGINAPYDTPSVSRSAGVMQCNNVWCHTGKYNSGTYAAPFWNTTGMVKETGTTVGDCIKCHAMPPSGYASHPAALTNSAALSTIVASCQGCHANISSSATNVGNAFVDKNIHVDGKIDASNGHAATFPGASHAGYSGATTPATSCAGCHVNWNVAGPYPAAVLGDPPNCRGCHISVISTGVTVSCLDCHGSDATVGRPNGNVFPNISGSHTKHVVNQAMACSACHDSKGGNIGDTTHGGSGRVAHDNSNKNTFVNVTSTGKQFHFTWAGGTGRGTCSTNSCHATAEWSVTKLQCNSCHSYLATDSWNTTYGVEGIGAHVKHINYLLTRNNVVGWSANDTYGSANFNLVCGVCHSRNVSDHSINKSNNIRTINFGGVTNRQFGASAPLYNGDMTTQGGGSSSVKPKSCSNTDCHYRTSPIWSTY